MYPEWFDKTTHKYSVKTFTVFLNSHSLKMFSVHLLYKITFFLQNEPRGGLSIDMFHKVL